MGYNKAKTHLRLPAIVIDSVIIIDNPNVAVKVRHSFDFLVHLPARCHQIVHQITNLRI